MSNYPSWWDTSLTIYNKLEDQQTRVVTWYKTVISNCFWKYVGNKVNIGDVVMETNNIICRIPKDDRFLEKYQWLQLGNDAKSDYFTLGAGDIIIKGEVDDIVDEYTSGHRSTDLIKKYKALQGCMEVERTTIDTGIGRCCEHYYVVGV